MVMSNKQDIDSMQVVALILMFVGTAAAETNAMIRSDSFTFSAISTQNMGLSCAIKCLEQGEACSGFEVDEDLNCRLLPCETDNAHNASKAELKAIKDGGCEPNNESPTTQQHDPPHCPAPVTTCNVANSKQDCLAWRDAGHMTDGIYAIAPTGSATPLCSYCDMTTDGGGWTVFQRRVSNSIDFYLGRCQYIAGFGDLLTNHWLGLDNLNALTTNTQSELRVDLETADGNASYAMYSTFTVGSAPGYMLSIADYSGTAPDDMIEHANLNGIQFSTYDHDVDRNSGNCAVNRQGAWWYNTCGYSNLNGPYKTPNTAGVKTMYWHHATGGKYALKSASMMLRRK